MLSALELNIERLRHITALTNDVGQQHQFLNHPNENNFDWIRNTFRSMLSRHSMCIRVLNKPSRNNLKPSLLKPLGLDLVRVSGMTPPVGRPDGLTILIKTNQALVLSWLEVVLSWLVENPLLTLSSSLSSY